MSRWPLWCFDPRLYDRCRGFGCSVSSRVFLVWMNVDFSFTWLFHVSLGIDILRLFLLFLRCLLQRGMPEAAPNQHEEVVLVVAEADRGVGGAVGASPASRTGSTAMVMRTGVQQHMAAVVSGEKRVIRRSHLTGSAHPTGGHASPTVAVAVEDFEEERLKGILNAPQGDFMNVGVVLAVAVSSSVRVLDVAIGEPQLTMCFHSWVFLLITIGFLCRFMLFLKE